MIALTTPSKAQTAVADHVRTRRLAMDLTQEGLASRSGVPIATLRRFERQGAISLESLLKLLMVVGGIEEVVTALTPRQTAFSSIDEVLNADSGKTTRKRGRRA